MRMCANLVSQKLSTFGMTTNIFTTEGNQVQFFTDYRTVFLFIHFHQNVTRKTRSVKADKTLSEQEKTSISLKIMALNEKKSFRVKFCGECIVNQELSKYMVKNSKSVS